VRTALFAAVMVAVSVAAVPAVAAAAGSAGPTVVVNVSTVDGRPPAAPPGAVPADDPASVTLAKVGVHTLRVPAASVPSAARRWAQDPQVTALSAPAVTTAAVIPDDPFYVHQWQHPRTSAPEAWE